MNDTPKSINNIKRARLERNVTQASLGRMIGVSQSVIAQYEAGIRNPKIEQLMKIATALEIDVNELLDSNLDSPILNGMKRTNSPLENEYRKRLIVDSIDITSLDAELIKQFQKLNDVGKEKVITYINDLSEMNKYKK